MYEFRVTTFELGAEQDTQGSKQEVNIRKELHDLLVLNQ
jgi:hypothetical protein